MSKKRDEGDDKNSPSLPPDLIMEILTRLPPKSVSKLICVSKLWLSIIQSKLFTELYLTRSSTRPCLVFEIYCGGDRWFFHSASQEDPSSDHRANTIPLVDHRGNTIPLVDHRANTEVLPPVRGLICWRTNFNLVIINPSTSQFLNLPKPKISQLSKFTFFVYDPVNDLYKVLCVTHGGGGSVVVSEEHQVFTLGAQETKWRMIECKHPHLPVTQGLCRNGVVYYGAWTNSSNEKSRSVLVSFDLRFEEFGVIALPENVQIKRHYLSGLVNYNGKIALVDQSLIGKFDFWVLEDVSEQEWSKVSVTVPSWNDLAGNDLYRCTGTIKTGELVFSPDSTTKFFVIYYDPKEDKARRVEFQMKRVEFQMRRDVFIGNTFFLDHIESPMFLPRMILDE